MTSHGYDYEPIFIYLKSGDSNPYLIVNGGFGKPDCYFHKNEVRPRKDKKDNDTRHVTTTLSPYPSYPFGQDGNIKYHGCVKTYPLDSGEDLQFEEEYHPLFGIRSCSNVFSGAKGDMHGHRFNPIEETNGYSSQKMVFSSLRRYKRHAVWSRYCRSIYFALHKIP